MSLHADIIREQSQPAATKMILLVMDGVGDIHTAAAPQTSLEKAKTPNLDALAKTSALGRSLPVTHGITPGSGPGHLGLFGYDASLPEHRIGRGVLEALGIDYDLKPGELAARGNFCTLDAEGRITDRRAGRPSTEDCVRVCKLIDEAVGSIGDVRVRVLPVQEHRFCVIFQGPDLYPDLADTDPQKTGVPPLGVTVRDDAASGAGDEETVRHAAGAAHTLRTVGEFIATARDALSAEPVINGLTLRGFSMRPALATWPDLYGLNPAAVAAYPLYRGVARLAGMKVLETGKATEEQFRTVEANWKNHDFFFIHIKKTDSSGEDGNQEAKVKAIEAVDAALPILTGLKPDVIAVTGDHCTPFVMKGHSWHPVPLLIHGPFCDVDRGSRYTETECLCGSVGTIPSHGLLALMLANAGRLAKFGA